MKFFFDENFPKAAGKLLRKHGHEWIDIRGTDQEGSDDRTIFDDAQRQEAVFLTTDRDFFHTVPHLGDPHCGVVVIALRQPNRDNILDRLKWFLDHFGDADLKNRAFELRDRTYVVFPSLPENSSDTDGPANPTEDNSSTT
jgi:predicted nuclease of predicted toxin-antitoxin system